jgi:hypothetical protein
MIAVLGGGGERGFHRAPKDWAGFRKYAGGPFPQARIAPERVP